MGEGGFSGAGDAGEADEKAEGDLRIELADIVAGGAGDNDFSLGGFAAGFWDAD